MYMHRKEFLLLLSLPYITTSTVYSVTPDDHYYPYRLSFMKVHFCTQRHDDI